MSQGTYFHSEVVGCYYYGGVAGRRFGETLHLSRNPLNPHDPNAIEVRTIDGRHIGHLPKEVALAFARELDAGLPFHAVITDVVHGHGIPPNQHPSRLKVSIVHGHPPPRSMAPEPAPTYCPSPAPTSAKSQCFVVTAACGSESDPLVQAFRSWRDRTLANSRSGRHLIRSYMAIGPHLALLLRRHPPLRRAANRSLHRLAKLLGLT